MALSKINKRKNKIGGIDKAQNSGQKSLCYNKISSGIHKNVENCADFNNCNPRKILSSRKILQTFTQKRTSKVFYEAVGMKNFL